MEALYAFARVTDDLGDETSQDDLNLSRLKGWQHDTIFNLSQGSTHTLVLDEYSLLWPALADAVQRYSIPTALLNDLIEGCRSDQHFTQPADWDGTLQYCYQVAATVGIACTYIWKADELAPHEPALKCGYAFQLTNILRDIAEDAASGRIYLPAADFERFGVSQESWLAGTPQPTWKDMVEACILRARGYYSEGLQISDSLAPDGRRMFRLMWRSYHQLLENITLHIDQLWTGPRIRLTRLQKLRLAGGAVLRY